MKTVKRLLLFLTLAITALAQLPFGMAPNPGISDPRNLGNLAAWYDSSNTASLTYNSSNQVQLWADISGNSAVNCLCLNGVIGNYASAPDSAALSITGDIDIRVRVAMDDWTPAATTALVSKWASGQLSYNFCVTTAGLLRLITSNDGTATSTFSSSVAPTVSDYATLWVRVAFTVADRVATFYTSTDGSSWTQLGTPTTPSGATSIFNSTAVLELGTSAVGTADRLSGRIYRAQILNGIAGTVAFDANFALPAKLATSFTESSSNAATVTINTSGDTGARISGERDLVQMTASKRPVYLAYSGTKYGYQSGAAGDTYTAANASVTGNQTFSLDLQLLDYTPGSNLTIVDKLATNDGFQVLLLTTGVVRLRVGDGASVTNVDSTAANTLVDGARGTLGIAWTDGVGASFTQNGSALGTSVAAVKTLTNAATSITIGASTLGKIYGVTVGSVYSFAPSSYTSGSTFVGPLGNTWTLNGGSTIVTRTCLYGDGSDDYMKAAAFSLSQPETVYFVGQQVSWTLNRNIFDGNASDTMAVYQSASTPRIRQYAGLTGTENTGLAISTGAVITSVFNQSSSTLRINRSVGVGAATVGSSNGNGFAVFSNGAGSANANATVSEIDLYSAAQDTAYQNAFAWYADVKWKLGF